MSSSRQHPQPPLHTAHAGRLARLAAVLAATLGGFVAPPALHAEESLGRLFFTPEQRQALDRQRQMEGPGRSASAADPTLTVNGVVARSNGKRTVWINGTAHTERELRSGAVVSAPGLGAGKLRVRPEGAPPADLRVGETLDVGSGQTHSPLNEGRIGRGKRSD